MASNKTTNLGLDIWAEMDYFKRAEVNTNFNKLDDNIGVLTDTSNFLSLKKYKSLKVAIAEGYDWSLAISRAVLDAKSGNKKLVLHTDEDMYITQSIVPTNTTKIVGFGKYNSKIKLKGAIKGIDLSSTSAKTGVEISSISIEGDKTVGQIGIDAYYLVNGSSIRDILIQNVDVGIRVTKSWYASFSDIRINNCLSYGLHTKSASNSEQINAISFKSLYIQGAKNAVFLEGVNVSASVKFDSCTFEASLETAVISTGFAPLTFDNCYFESNYKNALTIDTLTYDKPIDIKITSTTTRNTVRFTGCHFARANNFLNSTQKTSIYLSENTKAIFESCQFVCNTSGYMDCNIYSVSSDPAKITKCSEDGYATSMYIGAQEEEIIMIDKVYNLRYVSTIDPNMVGIIQKSGTYYLKFVPHATGTVSEIATMRLETVSDSTLQGAVINFPTSFVKDQPLEFKIGNLVAPKVVQLKGGVATSTDLNGTIYLVRKHNS